MIEADKKLVLNIRGTVYLAEPPPGHIPGRFTFQRVRAGFGNLPGGTGYDMQIRRTVTPADPMTPAQMARSGGQDEEKAQGYGWGA